MIYYFVISLIGVSLRHPCPGIPLTHSRLNLGNMSAQKSKTDAKCLLNSCKIGAARQTKVLTQPLQSLYYLPPPTSYIYLNQVLSKLVKRILIVFVNIESNPLPFFPTNLQTRFKLFNKINCSNDLRDIFDHNNKTIVYPSVIQTRGS